MDYRFTRIGKVGVVTHDDVTATVKNLAKNVDKDGKSIMGVLACLQLSRLFYGSFDDESWFDEIDMQQCRHAIIVVQENVITMMMI